MTAAFQLYKGGVYKGYCLWMDEWMDNGCTCTYNIVFVYKLLTSTRLLCHKDANHVNHAGKVKVIRHRQVLPLLGITLYFLL